MIVMQCPYAGWTPTDIESGADGQPVIRWQNQVLDAGIALTEREIEHARWGRWRGKIGELSPAELAVEIERWEQQRALLVGDSGANDHEIDAATTEAGIAYIDLRLNELERQAKRMLRAAVAPHGAVDAAFARAKYVDLVGLAETLTGEPARKTGRNYRIRCPFHEDRHPSLLLYPPGLGWWCPVCHRGGQDAASFCAEFFGCSQLEGLRWVEHLAVGVETG